MLHTVAAVGKVWHPTTVQNDEGSICCFSLHDQCPEQLSGWQLSQKVVMHHRPACGGFT